MVLQPGSSSKPASKRPTDASTHAGGTNNRTVQPPARAPPASKPVLQCKQRTQPPEGTNTPSRQQQQQLPRGKRSKQAADKQRPFPPRRRDTQPDHRYTQSPAIAQQLLQPLLQLADSSETPVLVGFDTETPVKWQQGPNGRRHCPNLPVALMQLCYQPKNMIPGGLLLQLSEMGFPQPLVQLLEHPNIIKVGAGVADDVYHLQRAFPAAAACQPQGFLDLSWLAYACDVVKPPSPQEQQAFEAKAAQGIKSFPRQEQWSLSGLLLTTTGLVLEKQRRLQMSDWSRTPLTQAQQAYAAADAWASLACAASLQAIWQRQGQQQGQWQELRQRQGQQQQQQASAPNSIQQAQGQLPEPATAPSTFLRMMGGPLISNAYSLRDRTLSSVDQSAAWQEVLRRGCCVTAAQLEQLQRNALQKAEAGEEEWLLGAHSDPHWASARSGFMDSPWGPGS